MKLFGSFGPTSRKSSIFILGCQRSGTTLLERIFDVAIGISVYGEGDKRAMRTKNFYRIRDQRTIRRLIARDPERIVAFKPLNDSQHADRLLQAHPNAKVIWIYRSFGDTINSMVRKWGSHESNIVKWIRDNAPTPRLAADQPSFAIYAERMHPDTLARISSLANDRITDEDGAALVWYIRNRIFFDLNLQNDRRVLLVRYEDLVTDPESNLARIGDFAGCTLDSTCSAIIVSSSIAKEASPTLQGPIEELCRTLQASLDATYETQRRLNRFSMPIVLP